MPGFLTSHKVVNPGLFYMAEVVSQLALRTTADRLSDRYGRSVVAGVGLLLMGLSVSSLFLVYNDAETMMAGLVSGASWAIFGPVLMAWLFDLAPQERYGLASATYFTAQDIGRVSGSIVMGYIAVTLGTATPFSISGSVVTVVALCLIFFSILNLRKRLRAEEPF